MRFGIADDGDAYGKALRRGAFRNSLCGIVGALGVNVGTKFLQQALDIGLWKKDYEIHWAKGCYELGARLFVENGTTGALELAKAAVRVNADDQKIAFLLCALQIADMADVQRVETAVGEHHALPFLPGIGNQRSKFIDGQDFGVGGTHRSGLLRGGLVNRLKKFIARYSGRTALHDHQASGDIGQMSGLQRRSARGQRQGVGG